MKKLMITKVALAAGLTLSFGAYAQEAEDPIAAAAAAAVAQVQQAVASLPEATVKAVEAKEKAENPAPTAEEMKKDEGVQAVVKVQSAPKEEPKANPRKKSAKEMVKAILKNSGIKEGNKKGRIVQVVDVSFPAEDPAKDTEFFVKRDQFAKLAVLQLKGQIAQGVGQVFSAAEVAEIFGGSTNAEIHITSLSESVAKWPLFGVTMLAQAESWDGKDYHIAVAGVWSKVLHRAAKATLLGEKVTGAAGKKTLDQWLEEKDLSLLCGPRQMLNEKGNRVFLGISAREIGVNAARDLVSKQAARASANASLIFSLYSDVEQYLAHAAVAGMYEKKEKAVAEASEMVDLRLSQTVENRAIAGASEIYSTEMKHPLTGKQIYVSVYSLDVESAANARVMAEELIATRVATELANKNALGRLQGYQDKVEAAKADTESFNKGRAEGQKAISDKLDQSKKQVQSDVEAVEKAPAKAQKGVVSGEGTIDDDF